MNAKQLNCLFSISSSESSQPNQLAVSQDTSKSHLHILVGIIMTFLFILTFVLIIVCLRRKKQHHGGTDYKKRVIVMKPVSCSASTLRCFIPINSEK